MSMHLHHPSLSLNGKKKGKVKFRNAEEARKARELAADWDRLKAKWAVPAKEKRVGKIFEPLHTGGYKLTTPVGRETPRYPSRSTGDGIASSKPVPQYTGSEMIGVTILHKSCLQPVFTEQEAKDAANMRR